MTNPINTTRRSILTAGAAALAMGGLSATRTAAQSAVSATASQGRRMLGALEVSAIGLGVQNHSRTFHTTIPNRAEMHKIIRRAVDEGTTFVDTAEVYGPHESERILGEASGNIRDRIQIATKFGFNVDLETGQWAPGLISDPSHIKQAVEGSLRRLRTDRIDLLYQHRVDPTVPIEDVAGAVRDLDRKSVV